VHAGRILGLDLDILRDASSARRLNKNIEAHSA